MDITPIMIMHMIKKPQNSLRGDLPENEANLL